MSSLVLGNGWVQEKTSQTVLLGWCKRKLSEWYWSANSAIFTTKVAQCSSRNVPHRLLMTLQTEYKVNIMKLSFLFNMTVYIKTEMLSLKQTVAKSM